MSGRGRKEGKERAGPLPGQGSFKLQQKAPSNANPDCTCIFCGLVLGSAESCYAHVKKFHREERLKSQENEYLEFQSPDKPWICHLKTCNQVGLFPTYDALRTHITHTHRRTDDSRDPKVFACRWVECYTNFRAEGDQLKHEKSHRTPWEGRFFCGIPDCPTNDPRGHGPDRIYDRGHATAEERSLHEVAHHPGWVKLGRPPVRSLAEAASLVTAAGLRSGGSAPSTGGEELYRCRQRGCYHVPFIVMFRRDHHEWEAHERQGNADFVCEKEDCRGQFSWLDDLQEHYKQRHPDRHIPTEEKDCRCRICPDKANSKTARNNHERDKHPKEIVKAKAAGQRAFASAKDPWVCHIGDCKFLSVFPTHKLAELHRLRLHKGTEDPNENVCRWYDCGIIPPGASHNLGTHESSHLGPTD